MTVDQADLARLQGKLESIARPALERLTERSATYAQRQAAADAPRATGALAHSIVSAGRGFEIRVRSAMPYAMPVEFGRRPGAPMPPAGAFKGRGPFAFAIARAIARRGIKGRFFMKRAVDMLRNGELPRLLSRAASEIESAWGRR
jgi:hypothetical protein